ncbi:MAG: 2-oxoacid:ferredoxin oxidoreductase subunit gamma [Candidatus Chloroheliales bacterium]|nr:MAG: 2-oxoacid:ferredoxin oxidoreductase subunit gamma [Chloroflexota bacterium]
MSVAVKGLLSRRTEVELAGVGGQGLALAGIILAEAAGIYGPNYVMQIEIHGISTRGGFSRSDVVISPEPIDYPGVLNPNVLLAMNKEELALFLPRMAEGGVILAESAMVRETPPSLPTGVSFYRLPLMQIAREQTGAILATSIVALGAIGALTGVVEADALEQAVRGRIPAKALDTNLAAMRAGWAAALAAKEGASATLLQSERNSSGLQSQRRASPGA